MISSLMRSVGLVVALGTATVAAAQDSNNRVAANTDWSVFEGTDPRECWIVSAPKETVNTRDGNVVAVRRGDILLYVFFRPASGVAGQVAFTGGYPFASDSTVNLEIGGTNFDLYVQDEYAWPADAAADAAIVAAMKAGANATLTARSSRGTVTRDTFSLLGFTASLDEAQRRCAG
ncbi:hypothetical protein BVC71_08250 [Marivivens niveibacter]|uniref:Invasion associated locus B family protein n=1 Tax=Marivivens niveibacter TaxID=1930667 RepID=A0A251WZP6_9RHOB|nr:invasion associated locus B family protein [Marivivens niveibacter]OUD09806.1 hypothetical protein BVC71_08250 [Marivivens niveibacter]